MKKLLFIFILILPGVLPAQTGSMQGAVRDNEGVLPGVNILITELIRGGVTDNSGRYKITGIPIGTYRVRFSSVGYNSEFRNVTIYANKTVELDVKLEQTTIEVDEVEVFGENLRDASDTKTSIIDLDPLRAKIIPGAVEDVLRTLQSLPGVLAPNDYSSQLVVRGSGPDQNLIIIDNVEIFNPYRLYGAISMFNPNAVSDIDLITGGFPAEYGDRLSAVLDVTGREGAKNTPFTGSLNASIISANLVLEGKNPFEIKGSWLVSSRRTYYDLIIEPFVKSAGLIEDDVQFPNFYDIQSKLTFGPFDGHKFFVQGIYSADGVDVVNAPTTERPDSISANNITRNDVLSGSWHYAPTDKALNIAVFSWYRNKGIAGFDSEVLDPSLNRENFEEFLPDTLDQYLLNVEFNTDFIFQKYSFDDKFTLIWNDNIFEAGAGFDLMTTEINLDVEIDPELLARFNANPRVRTSVGNLSDLRNYERYRGYVMNNFKITDRLHFNPGLRFDYYNILEKSYLAPRVSVSYGLDEVTTLRANWGIYYQSPGYEKLLDAAVLYDLSQEYSSKLDAEKATHYILGFERWLTPEWNLRVETYYKDFSDLIIPLSVEGTGYYTERVPGRDPNLRSGWTRPVPYIKDSLTTIPVNGSYGESYGIEFLLAKKNIEKGSRINGWISYAFAYAHRYEDGIKIPFKFDQRHTMNVVLDYWLNEYWNFGLRFQLGSGYPYTKPDGVTPRVILFDTDGDMDPETPGIVTRGEGDGDVVFDVNYENRTRYNSRKPVYHRLDIRISALADFWNMNWIFYLDVINVYNHSNIIGYRYYANDDLKLESIASSMFPIVPTLGFSVNF